MDLNLLDIQKEQMNLAFLSGWIQEKRRSKTLKSLSDKDKNSLHDVWEAK